MQQMHIKVTEWWTFANVQDTERNFLDMLTYIQTFTAKYVERKFWETYTCCRKDDVEKEIYRRRRHENIFYRFTLLKSQLVFTKYKYFWEKPCMHKLKKMHVSHISRL